MLPAFVINLDRSLDRRTFIEAEAARIGLRFERISAVDGLNVPDWLRGEFLAPDGSIASSLIPSEVGCYASHLLVHKRIVLEGLPCALVLEDDVELEIDLLPTIAAAIAAAPAGWDYIHLSGLVRRTVYSLAALPSGRHLVRHSRIPTNTGGYLISRSGAEKMLAPSLRIRPIDQEFRRPWLRGLDVLAVYPSPVIWSDHMPTTIEWRGLPKRDFDVKLAKWRERTYVASKLGGFGYTRCMLANLLYAAERRLRGRPRGEVLIVCQS
jgi:glycosyl transferase family 25